MELWNRHGVCSSNNICTDTYFEKGVDQSKKLVYLLDVVLAASQIVPSPTVLYTAEQIELAVQKVIGTGKSVYISCKPIAGTSKEFMLNEIYICLDKMADDYVSCLATKKSNCGDTKVKTIKFPPFPTTKQGQPGPIEDLGFTELVVDNIPMLL